jgi:hypothetical protein
VPSGAFPDGMSENEQETEPDDDLPEAREGKGYGDDEGEREEALDDEQ